MRVLTCASSRSSFLLASSVCSSSSVASARFLLREDDDAEKGKLICESRDEKLAPRRRLCAL